ncbi:aldehyde dehydrogenase [Schumannella soli]|uniref:Aldehyde dehydrogenase n=2 Tax=Schumannella soli TaxID=2590779 RepID=A0A506XZH3_9MICO|nr:aldehyde dehydrogenase [Schumannella soli]
MTAMQECMEACSAAAVAATMCSDADMGDGMARCSSMCANMADVATTTMRMMMRPTGMDMSAMKAMMGACMAMGEACAAECRSHAEMAEHCRICMMACEAMVASCSKMMASMA